VHRIFWLPLGMAAAESYLRSHVPAGYRLTTTGQESGPGGTELETVGGQAQPELQDLHERLAAEASRILAAASGR
jgi:hypothetical protein